MPRPKRCRRICCFPEHRVFAPAAEDEDQGAYVAELGRMTAGPDTVMMSLDEYETIRLIDHDGMTQEECARSMDVARTTITAIYESARRKLAEVIVEGKQLVIGGGMITVSDEGTPDIKEDIRSKGDKAMRVAVTYEDGNVFQHFGHTEQFKVYDIEDDQIVHEMVMGSNGQGHGALAGLLAAVKADILICGGIGMGAQMALAEAGVKLYAGVTGSADEAVMKLIDGSLEYTAEANCDHHGQHHEGHDCGNHMPGSCGHGCH